MFFASGSCGAIYVVHDFTSGDIWQEMEAFMRVVQPCNMTAPSAPIERWLLFHNGSPLASRVGLCSLLFFYARSCKGFLDNSREHEARDNLYLSFPLLFLL